MSLFTPAICKIASSFDKGVNSNYFLAVAREDSITKATESHHVTQPPLFRPSKALADELGKRLLIRGDKKVTLTEDGMLLRKRTEEMVDLMEKLDKGQIAFGLLTGQCIIHPFTSLYHPAKPQLN